MMGTTRNSKRWKRFRSTSLLGLIAILSTLLLLDVKCGLDNNDVDDDAQNPPHRLQVRRGMDSPLQDSTRGDVVVSFGIKETPVRIQLFVFTSGMRKE